MVGSAKQTHPHALPSGDGSKRSQGSKSPKRPQHLQILILLDKQTKYRNLDKTHHSMRQKQSAQL
jgi:hypothetical protein